jgi:RsmE family RNA methyltransferase
VNLILLEPAEVRSDGVVALSGRRARHLLDVLQVQPGHDVRLGIVDGGLGTGRVLSIEGNTVMLQCVIESVPERPSVDLLLALPRPKVLQRLWAQIAALGVGQVILTNAERVERNYFDTHVLTPEVYHPLLLEGLQQARDTHVPHISIHRRLKVLVEDDLGRLCPRTWRVVAHPGETRTFAEAVGAGSARPRDEWPRTLLAVGPEGGCTDYELNLLLSHGFEAVGMGPRTLRSDTACIALLALLHEALR